MERLTFAVALISALGTALLAGNFFAFSTSIMRALGGLSAERGIVAMQAVVAALKGPLFLIVFFGTALLSVILVGLSAFTWDAPGSCTLLVGALLFLLGPFAVTMLRNVPLNTRLTAASPDTDEARALWREIQPAWVFWNHVRTVTALLACASLIMALTEIGNPFTL